LCTGIKSQCDNFGYYINEIVGPANEAYFNSAEVNCLCLNATEEEDYAVQMADVKKAFSLAGTITNNLGVCEVAIQNARTNAENCYCVNGQKAIYSIDEEFVQAQDLATETYKYLKAAAKSKDQEQIKNFLNLALVSIQKLQESVEKVSSIASDKIDACR
jgi:hypothetical protein